jgi:hypothetical protein
MFPFHRLYPKPCRFFLRKALLSMVMISATGWNTLAAQEICDPGNSLFVAEGTVLHQAETVPQPEPPHHTRRSRKPATPNRAVAVKKHRDPEKPRQDIEAQESAHRAATGFAEKKGRAIILRPEESRYGILIPGPSGKNGGLPPEAAPFPVSKILSAADLMKHKFLYRESFRNEESSYHNSCRPPPFSSARRPERSMV